MDPYTLSLALALLAAIGLVVISLFVVRDHRTVVPIAWFVTICFVPVWVGFSPALPDLFGIQLRTGVYLSAAATCALLLMFVLFFMPSIKQVRWTGADLWMSAFFVACLLPVLLSASANVIVLVVLVGWIPGFALGRLMPTKVPVSAIYLAAAVVFSVAALLGVIEFFAHWNPFVGIRASNALYSTWSGLQERGGIVRAEGAFGHSIAFGSSMALGVPLLLSSSLRSHLKLTGLTLIGAAALVSFSRIGMIATSLTVVLSLIFLRKTITFGLRTVIALVSASLALAAAPFVSSVFTDAGQEAAGSAAYRGDLFSLLPDMEPLGLSRSLAVSSAGTTEFGGFQSVDNTVILTGLRYGWLPMVIIVGVMLAAIISLLRNRATPPLIALIALIPAMFSVSLITQFGLLVWFVVGFATEQQAMRRTDRTDPDAQIAEPSSARPRRRRADADLTSSPGIQVET